MEQHNITTADTLIGTCNVGGNHWTDIVINLKSKKFLFMDPKRDMGIDYTCGFKYNNMWQLYSKVWNREHQNLLPIVYATETLPHDMQPQDDSNNCGIYTLMASISFVYFLRELRPLQKLKKVVMTTFLYLQFAWKYLMGEDIILIDPDTDGPTIAAEIMQASTLSNECITCGQLCNESHPYKICCGGC